MRLCLVHSNSSRAGEAFGAATLGPGYDNNRQNPSHYPRVKMGYEIDGSSSPIGSRCAAERLEHMNENRAIRRARTSRRHHEIPIWLLKNFCARESKALWIGDKETGQVKSRSLRNLFVRRDGNTRTEYRLDANGILRSFNSDVDELKLKAFDNQASSCGRQLLRSARSYKATRDASGLVSAQLAHECKRIIAAQARRTRESQDRIGLLRDSESIYVSGYYDRADELGHELPSREAFVSDPQVQRVFADLDQNIRSNFSSGDDPILVQEENQFLQRHGLSVAVVAQSNSQFVIGSHGLTIIPTPSGNHSWLPLALDVAISLSTVPFSCSFRVVDRRFVKTHNRSALACSNRIASRSQFLVSELLGS